MPLTSSGEHSVIASLVSSMAASLDAEGVALLSLVDDSLCALVVAGSLDAAPLVIHAHRAIDTQTAALVDGIQIIPLQTSAYLLAIRGGSCDPHLTAAHARALSSLLVPMLDERGFLELLGYPAFVVHATTWRYLAANSAALALWSRLPSQILGKEMWALYPGLSESDFGKTYKAGAEAMEPRDVVSFVPYTGRWYSASISPGQRCHLIRFSDVTAAQQQQLGQSLSSDLRQLIERAQTPSSLLESVARELQRRTGWRRAETWFAQCCQDRLALHSVLPDPQLGSDALAQAPSGVVLDSSSSPLWSALRSNAFTSLDLLALSDEHLPHRARALEAGLRWACVIPVASAESAVGLILLLHDQPLNLNGWFDILSQLHEPLSHYLSSRVEHIELDALFMFARDMVCIAGVDGYLKRVNRVFSATLGWSVEALMSRPIIEFIHPDDREHAIYAFDQLIKNGSSNRVEIRYITPSGETRWLSWTAVPAPERGTVYAIARDVTDQHVAREALATSEARFRLLARATSDAAWDMDVRAQMVWCDEGYSALLGDVQRAQEMAADAWFERIHPADRAAIAASRAQALQDEGVTLWSGEYRCVTSAGLMIWVLDRAYIVRDLHDQPIRMVGGVTDITPRKRSELQARWQAKLLEQTSDAILVARLDGSIRFVNRAAENIFGISVPEAIHMSALELMGQDPRSHAVALERLFAAGTWSGEATRRLPGKREPQRLELRWTLLLDEQGRSEEILIAVTDVTARKQAERQALRSQRLESIGTLAGGVAHDLNNILAPIMLCANLLEQDLRDPEQLATLREISRAAERGASVLLQLLTFARGAEGLRTLVDPVALLRDTARMIRESFPRHISLHVELPEQVVPVMGDATQLHQVLLNLAINARDAMPSGGRLSLVLSSAQLGDEHPLVLQQRLTPGYYVTISVTDTGVGIPTELHESIFEPFFTTKPIGEGTGLGLPTALTIVEGHKGLLQLSSALGQGTRFVLYLPAAEGSLDESSTPITRPLRGGGELILVVDDEELMRSVMRQTLESFNYRVITACDGAEAIAMFSSNMREIDATLIDLMMPQVDGISACHVIRKLSPGAAILGLSGSRAQNAAPRFAEAGVHHFLAKPFTAEVLLIKLRALLDARISSR